MLTPPLPQPATPTRNLTVPLAQWLRKMGFVVLEQGGAEPTALEATWRALDGLVFQLSYTYAAQQGVFQLLGRYGSPALVGSHYGLVHKAHINRLREARLLLTSNVYYDQARQEALSAGALQPTHAQSAAP